MIPADPINETRLLRNTSIPGRGPFGCLDILAVEDDPTNRHVLRCTLESLGCSPTIAETGRQALHLLAERSFDLILLDLHLPDFDGFEVLRRRSLESIDQAVRPWIVAVTARDPRLLKRRCREAGLDDCLGKPIRKHELVRVLTQASSHGKPPLALVPPCPLPHLDIPDEFDAQIILDLLCLGRRNGRPLLAEVSDQFHRALPDLLSSLDAALESGAIDSAIAASHRLRGSAATLGIRELTEICEALNNALRGARLHNPRIWMTEIRLAAERAGHHLDQILQIEMRHGHGHGHGNVDGSAPQLHAMSTV